MHTDRYRTNVTKVIGAFRENAEKNTHPEIELQYILGLHKIYYDFTHGAIMRDRLNHRLLVALQNDTLHMLYVGNIALPNTLQIQLLFSQMTNSIKTKTLNLYDTLTTLILKLGLGSKIQTIKSSTM
jgi:hypothetical protein